MRLKSIKLAGFKSFVDPTTVNFPSNLAGVVGPNGCGKSNVIDAVRWVMGESSAKQLRGDSMTDVIFNGSSGRKPVGQASIELIFDNDSGRIAGEYAGYSEISIRRRVTREGQSDYFLNGSKCRRRDITDIFLGTGLGPRSYSIIEQGMISSLITARPEDLRTYIEEAAGISKYKERRRDTENRIRRTRENLERLTDLRDELGRQLGRLQRQAQAAEKYREYKGEERELHQQLLALRWQALNADINTRKEAISNTELEVEKYVVAELSCNTEIEKFRDAIHERTDAFNTVQSKYYEIGAEIARLEQTIKHQEERKQQLQSDINRTEQSYQEVQNHINSDAAKVDGWKAELEELARQRVEAEMLAEETAAELEQLETFSAEAQDAWDRFQMSSAESRQRAEVEQSRIKHFEQSMQSIAARRERILSQLGDDETAKIAADQARELEQERALLEQKLEVAADAEQSESEIISSARTQLSDSANKLDEVRSKLQTTRGRLSSLEALQEAALSEGQSGVESWLLSNDLNHAPRLAETMNVEAGWELAVETVLGGVLKAICVDSIDAIANKFEDFSEGTLEVLEQEALEKSVALGLNLNKADSLASKVKEGISDSRLTSVYVAADLSAALARRKTLKPEESVITADGLWFGASWCRVSRGEALGSGVIERKAEIESLSIEIEQLEESEAQQREKISSLQASLQSSEEQQRQRRRDKELLASELSTVASKISALNAKHEQLLQQLEHSKAELGAANEQYEIEEAQLADARIAVAEAIDAMEQDTGRRDELLQRREETRVRLSESRNQNQQQAQMSQQFAMREQMVRTQLSSLEETTVRMQSQLEHLAERRETLRMTTGEDDSADNSTVAEELEERLEARLIIESKLTQAREELSAVEQSIQAQEEQRQRCQQSLLHVRERLQEQRLQAQDLLTRRRTLEEQLGEVEPEALVDELPDGANESEWSQRLEAIQTRIQRLGPINLAAIDEYKIESERKTFLDEQDAELVEALETLESAIRKIDKETRTRFRETFDKIDTGFKELFPRLFGGGHAYLELTGEDLLETGVTIMARPPGKRNSTIHLLSGGEKAMTAIALVFSIFHLNPAPFCMLDEVDAPLDDANVERFANMVKEMSEKVQFIYITHNKITMEIADQLMGVTMHEPGVSRLVTVDVESAIKMATS